MIQNQRQYNVTKGQISRLQDALTAARTTSDKMDPRVYKAMIAGIESQIMELTEGIQEYEALTKTHSLAMCSVGELPDILIKSRVARGYTQKDLANRVNIKPQLIQKYETTSYRSASWKRMLHIMKALDINFQAVIPLKSGQKRIMKGPDVSSSSKKVSGGYLICDKRQGSPKIHVEVCRKKCKLVNECRTYKEFIKESEVEAA
jgi:transcriptional regulator with XRE-family HTH domain